MKINTYNKASLIHIIPHKRFSNDFDSLIFFYQISGTKTKVQRTFNLPEKLNHKKLLIKWLMKKGISLTDNDLKNPHVLIDKILNLTKHKFYLVYLEMSKNKKFINAEDCKPYIKQ